jgi:type VI secretion system protein
MRPLVITVENLTTRERHLRAFYKSPVHLGRNELNDLPLPSEYVSLWHAVVRYDDDAVRYTDLGSKNGSQINGAAVEPNKAVEVGESVTVQIGDLKLEFSRDEALAEQADREPPATLFGSSGDGAEPPPPAESVSTRFYEIPKDLLKGPPPRKLPPAKAEPAPAPPEPPPPPPPPSRAPAAVAPIPLSQEVRPSPPSPRAAEAAAAGGAQEMIRAAMPHYTQFRDAWKNLRIELMHGLKALPRDKRGAALEQIKSQMPQVLKEEEFQVMLNALGIASLRTLAAMTSDGASPAAAPAPSAPAPAPAPVSSASTSAGQGDGAAQKLLARFARSYVPRAPQPGPGDAEKLLERVADVLETCAKMFVEFRKGHGQFAEHMAVRTQRQDTPLERAQDGREVLAYVLEWREGGHARVDELKEGFKQFMVHEIALLQGLRAGVRELLDSLSPDKVSESAGSSLLGAVGKWKRYVELFEDLAEEQTMTRKLFGPAFWRAYTAIVQETE